MCTCSFFYFSLSADQLIILNFARLRDVVVGYRTKNGYAAGARFRVRAWHDVIIFVANKLDTHLMVGCSGALRD